MRATASTIRFAEDQFFHRFQFVLDRGGFVEFSGASGDSMAPHFSVATLATPISAPLAPSL